MSFPSSFSIRQGEDITVPFRCVPVPFSLAGRYLEFRAEGVKNMESIVKNNLEVSDPAYKGGLSVTDGPDAKFSVSFGRSDTSSFDADMFVWSVRTVEAGSRTPLMGGSMYLLPDPEGA